MASSQAGISSRSRKSYNSEGASDTVDYGTQETSEFTQLRERPAAGPEALQEGSTRKSLLILALIFVCALVALGVVYSSFPQLDKDELQYIKLPRDIEDAKNLGRLLHRYNDKYFYEVLSGYFVVFIFLQTFAIPGSIFLSIISGFLYPFLLALPLVCTCSALGASFCYLLSYMVGRRVVQKYFPQRAADWKRHVDNHREHLFNYILFLRITPFLPNWFINITSPVIDVPLFTFFLGTLFGVAPPSFVFIQAGTTLNKLTSTSEAWSWMNIGLLAVFALVALLPVVLKRQLRAKLE
ncbi:transmembrane protein 41B isoform X2 [Aplysia californica]|uniref:Transmembrane protein 41B isoform X2 n=1 Tax=Aplysia californica TaxID=6500 RepID=A0ABM0K0D4_APLCA|nr:transmembrane protein 41B isoform X2 [Aplysia californica]